MPILYTNAISVRELVDIDYKKYNDIAQSFVTTYGLPDTVNELVVRMYIDVVGASEDFASDSADEYVIELYLPLIVDTVNPTVVTSVPAEEQKILAIDSSAKIGFLIAAISVGALDVIAITLLSIFIVVTRDKHIDYARKVKKILSNYRSYIQQITDPFNMADYQVLHLSKFTEMLEIRDTLQKPVLMYENEDKTHTAFFIATGSKELYVFEIDVEDDKK